MKNNGSKAKASTRPDPDQPDQAPDLPFPKDTDKPTLFLFRPTQHPSDYDPFLARWEERCSLLHQEEVRASFDAMGKKAITEMVQRIAVEALRLSSSPKVVFYSSPTELLKLAWSKVTGDASKELMATKMWPMLVQDKILRNNHLVSMVSEFSSLAESSGQTNAKRPELRSMNQFSHIVSHGVPNVDFALPHLILRPYSQAAATQAIADCIFETKDDNFDYTDMRKICRLRRCWSEVLPLVDAIAILSDDEIGVLEPALSVAIDSRTRHIHHPTSPAVVYPGEEFYVLEGIPVDKKWVTMKAEDITIEDILSIENVDVRRAVVGKIGSERFNFMLASTKDVAVLDKREGYELLDIPLNFSIANGRRTRGEPYHGKYLRMINPSTGAIHVEGVDNACGTVDDAIRWRAGNVEWNPSELT